MKRKERIEEAVRLFKNHPTEGRSPLAHAMAQALLKGEYEALVRELEDGPEQSEPSPDAQ